MLGPVEYDAPETDFFGKRRRFFADVGSSGEEVERFRHFPIGKERPAIEGRKRVS
jgi:hypothetical protein